MQILREYCEMDYLTRCTQGNRLGKRWILQKLLQKNSKVFVICQE